MTTRKAMYVDQTMEVSDGYFRPVIAVEGEKGYHLTNFRYGPSFRDAKAQVDEFNRELGLSPEDVLEIVISTMREE